MYMRMTFDVAISDVGPVLALVTGRVKNLNYEVIEPIPPGKHAPRGTGNNLMLDIIKNHPDSSGSAIRDLFVAAGRKRSGAQSAINALVLKKLVKKTKAGPKHYTYAVAS